MEKYSSMAFPCDDNESIHSYLVPTSYKHLRVKIIPSPQF